MARSHLLDPVHMLQHAYNEQDESFNVTMLPMELSIELNADDGDSVLVQNKMTVLENAQDSLSIDTSKVSKICVLSQDQSAQVQLKAVINDIEIPMGNLNLNEVKSLCVPAIKLVSNSPLILVLQS